MKFGSYHCRIYGVLLALLYSRSFELIRCTCLELRFDEKAKILLHCTRISGRKLNASKTKFMVIDRTAGDQEPVKVSDVSLEWCTEYVYLGAYFSCDGKIWSAIVRRCQKDQCEVLKFCRS